jgi:hypothetical protein
MDIVLPIFFDGLGVSCVRHGEMLSDESGSFMTYADVQTA